MGPPLLHPPKQNPSSSLDVLSANKAKGPPVAPHADLRDPYNYPKTTPIKLPLISQNGGPIGQPGWQSLNATFIVLTSKEMDQDNFLWDDIRGVNLLVYMELHWMKDLVNDWPVLPACPAAVHLLMDWCGLLYFACFQMRGSLIRSGLFQTDTNEHKHSFKQGSPKGNKMFFGSQSQGVLPG